MRFALAALLALAACSSGPDVDVTGLWLTQIGPTSICRVFCDDGLTLETFGDDPTCTDWSLFDGRLSCFPYSVDGDQLSIDDSLHDRVEVSQSGTQLTRSSNDGQPPLVYNRIGNSHSVCDQPCYHAGNADEPLR